MLYLQMMMKQLLSIVSVNPLPPNKVMQGAWSGKATKLDMVNRLGNLIPSEKPPMIFRS